MSWRASCSDGLFEELWSFFDLLLISLLIITESGLDKKVLIGEYPQKGRATASVVSTDLQEKDHILQTMLVDRDETLLVTWSGENGESLLGTKKGRPLFFQEEQAVRYSLLVAGLLDLNCRSELHLMVAPGQACGGCCPCWLGKYLGLAVPV